MQWLPIKSHFDPGQAYSKCVAYSKFRPFQNIMNSNRPNEKRYEYIPKRFPLARDTHTPTIEMRIVIA
jgi:hypothetical protein